MGRISTFTPEIGREICERLAGGETLTDMCADERLPAVRTVSHWRREHDEFAADFVRARDIGFDAIAERTRQTARGLGDSTKDVKRDRLIIETDLKLLAKWDSKRYGDALRLSGDPEAPLMLPTGAELPAEIAALIIEGLKHDGSDLA